MRIVEIEQTGFVCPAQWDGKLDDERRFYARYRHGRFYFEVENPDSGEGIKLLDIRVSALNETMTTEDMYSIIFDAGIIDSKPVT